MPIVKAALLVAAPDIIDNKKFTTSLIKKYGLDFLSRGVAYIS